MVIHLGAPLPAPSSNQPGSTDGPSLTLPYLVLLLVGFTWHPASPPNPVSSYLTLSPLPPFRLRRGFGGPCRQGVGGGLLSVALSLRLPSLDVIQHHALWSPDFPPSTFAKGYGGRRPSGLLRPKPKIGSTFNVQRSTLLSSPAASTATGAVPALTNSAARITEP